MRNFVLLLIALLFAAPAFAQYNTIEEEVIYRVSLGKPKDVKLLLKKTKDPHATDTLGWPLLTIAANRTDSDAFPMVKVLVDAGADVNYGGPRMNFPIMAAVQSSNAEIVRYFLDRGANYRVKDIYGVALVDFARSSGNPEIQQMIEEAVQQDIMDIANARSQRNLDKMTYDLAFHSCASQYYRYYYDSRQDPIPEDAQKVELLKHSKVIRKSMAHLKMIFAIEQKLLDRIGDEARKLIHYEMEQMVSNRWRRKQGVGQPGDMEKRCTEISKKWKDGFFDKEKLEHEQMMHGK